MSSSEDSILSVESDIETAEENTLDEASLPDEEPEEELVDVPLTINHIRQGISLICKTGDGIEVAYAKLTIDGMKLTRVDMLDNYIHLRYVNLSRNNLTSLKPLANMKFLMSLDASFNRLESVHLHDAACLKYLNLSNNRISSTHEVKQSSLEVLMLARNRITDLQDLTSDNLPSLQLLDLSDNLIESVKQVQLKSLTHLYIGSNKLESLADLDALPALETLHARNNPIASLAGLTTDVCPRVIYLNIRGSALSDATELNRLTNLKRLSILVVDESPLTSITENYRAEILSYVGRLKRIDKDPVTGEDLEEARALITQRKETKTNEDTATDKNGESS